MVQQLRTTTGAFCKHMQHFTGRVHYVVAPCQNGGSFVRIPLKNSRIVPHLTGVVCTRAAPGGRSGNKGRSHVLLASFHRNAPVACIAYAANPFLQMHTQAMSLLSHCDRRTCMHRGNKGGRLAVVRRQAATGLLVLMVPFLISASLVPSRSSHTSDACWLAAGRCTAWAPSGDGPSR